MQVNTLTSADATMSELNDRAKTPALAIVATGAGLLTLLIRLAMHVRAFDLYGDEVIYADLGRSVLSGGFPSFFGQVFFLHGPGFFYLESGWARLMGDPPGLMAWVYEMRMLNALLAAGTAVAVVLLAARAGSLRTGVVAGLLFSLDPFCIRQNDRVLLETAMMFWVLLGYLAFSSFIDQPSARGAWIRAVGCGLLFGCAVLTKDEAALLTVAPLLVIAVRWRGPGRRLTLLAVGSTVLSYASYLAVVVTNGYFAALWSAKTSGIQRLLGVIQTTGFHSSKGGSLTGRLIAEGGFFLTTYLLLVLAVPAVVMVLRHGAPLPRIVGLLYCAAAAVLGYAVTLGTLEEQELYLLVVPSLLIIAIAGTRPGRPGNRHRLNRHRWAARGKHRGWRMALGTSALALVLSVNVVTCGQWLRQPDDGFTLLLAYMTAHVPAGTAVTVAAGSPPPSQVDGGRYALEGSYTVGLWVSPTALRQEHVRYVMAEWGPITEGYSYLSPAKVRILVRHAIQVFSFRGRTYGDLVLYKLPR